MTARILVVDDIPANVSLLEARLVAEYFDVVTADNGRDALVLCEKGQIDLVLLDVMMPEMNGFEVCEKIRATPEVMSVPVVMVTALAHPRERLRAFMAGADDFLLKPVNDLVLVSRIRNLLARSRTDTSSHADPSDPPSVLVVGMPANDPDGAFRSFANPVYLDNPREALTRAVSGDFDFVVVYHDLAGSDPLRLCSQLRSTARTRNLPIILVVGEGDDAMTIKAFDIGVTDCFSEPLHAEELAVRVSNMALRGTKIAKTTASKTATVMSSVHQNSPIDFKVVDDVLVVQPRIDSTERQDERSVAAARAALVADGGRLSEDLKKSNLDRRLIDVFARQISILSSGMDIIQLGLINLESSAVLEAAEREGEILPTHSAGLQSFCLKTEMFVSQFKEWRRFSENARALPSLTAEIPALAAIADDLSGALSKNVADVDRAVPRSIDFVVEFAKNPKSTGFALVSLIENIVVAVADYCVGLLKGTAEVASKKLQTALGVGVAVAVSSALSAYLDVAGRLGLSPWVGPAVNVLKRFIATVSPL